MRPGPVHIRWLSIGLALLAGTIAFGVQHDYREYLVQWTAVLTGDDPWGGTNAYGPLHNLFAWLSAVWPLLPKVVFAALAVASAGLLTFRAAARDKGVRVEAVLLVVFLLNPIVFFSTFVYGQNDIVAAFFVLLALVARDADRPALSGVAVGMAALAKFYPLAFAGLLMLEGGRRVRLRVPVAAGVTFAAGLFASYLRWGPSTFTPLLFASGRNAKMLSPYRLVTCHPELVGGEGVVAALLDTNVFVVLGVGFGMLLLLHAIGATWKSAASLGFLAVLAAYKVGHPQFYVTWLICLAWLVVHASSSEDRRLVTALAPVAIFLALFQALYALTGAMTGDWTYLRCYVSLPFMAVVAWCLVQGVRAVWTRPALRPHVVW